MAAVTPGWESLPGRAPMKPRGFRRMRLPRGRARRRIVHTQQKEQP